MPGKRKPGHRKSPQPRMVIQERRGDDTSLKERIRALDGFPDLKVKDWMPVVMSHYNLKEKLSTSDERYWKINDFC